MQIQDPKLRAWALELHEIWKTLCRRINPEVKQNKDLHSILWVDENFIVPGEDSYQI
jgi:alpha,alpha-trehalase